MDGTHITALRTAGGATLSARLLARPDALTLAIVGGGVQGIAHAQLMPLVREKCHLIFGSGRAQRRVRHG